MAVDGSRWQQRAAFMGADDVEWRLLEAQIRPNLAAISGLGAGRRGLAIPPAVQPAPADVALGLIAVAMREGATRSHQDRHPGHRSAIWVNHGRGKVDHSPQRCAGRG